MAVDLVDNFVVVQRTRVALDKSDDRFDLLVGDEASLDAQRLGGTDRVKQHISTSEQLFCAAHVEDGAGVDLRGNRKRDSGGDIRFDDTGDDINRGPLGCNDQMHPGRARHLRQAADAVLDLVRCSHHQVSQLVNDNHDLRQRFHALGPGRQIVERFQVAHRVVREQLVPLEHLADRPGKRSSGLFGIGDNRDEQLGDAVIDAQLDHLGVDHQEPHLFGGGLKEQGDDDGVDADRFSGTGRTGNQQMGHLSNVGNRDVSGDVPPQCGGQMALRIAEHIRIYDLPDGDRRDHLVRDLNAHRRLVGDWGFNAHPCGCEVERDVVGQAGDLADLDPGRRLELIPGDRRPA